jgi:hypothetical protein
VSMPLDLPDRLLAHESWTIWQQLQVPDLSARQLDSDVDIDSSSTAPLWRILCILQAHQPQCASTRFRDNRLGKPDASTFRLIKSGAVQPGQDFLYLTGCIPNECQQKRSNHD